MMSVQRNAVVDLRQQIKGMTKNIQSFSSSMNSLYEDESLGTFSEAGIKLRNLRDDTRDAALVCLKDILPISTSFVSSVSDYFEYYDTMGYEQWCKLIPCILQKTIGYRQLSEKIRQVYEYSLIPLKQRQDQASIVQAEMSELKERYERKKTELNDTADTKKGWAIGLAFVPIVNIFATPALAVAAGEDYALANKNAAQAANMEAAAIKVGQTLIPALHALVSGIAKAAGFFSVMEQEMIKFQGKAEKGIESQKRLHYKVMKQEAQEMKYLCRAFNAALPQVKNDFAALKGNPDPLEKWMKFYFGRKGVK